MSGRRLAGALSLLLIGGFALAAAPSGFGVVEAYPLGGAAGQGGPVFRGLALLLGLLLGWGIPGVSIALLTNPAIGGYRLLSRALGLGIGYILTTGLVHALVFGHAPGRGALLMLLALPCLAAVGRQAQGEGDASVRALVPVLVAAFAMALLTALLWPKLRHEGMNGDGSEAYELSRSLEAHGLPHWEMEGAPSPGRFGTPTTVPYFTGAYVVYAEMMILGRGELAVRLPFVWSVVLLAAAAFGLSRSRGRLAWGYVIAVAAVFVIWNAFYVGYDPPFDIAEPAGTDALTIALWLCGFHELMTGMPAAGVAFMVMAAGTTYSAPVLTGLALAALWVFDRERARVATRRALVAALVLTPALALYGWRAGDWPDWVRQFRAEYWDDLVEAGRRVPWPPFLAKTLLLTGGLPLVILFRARRLSPSSRILAIVGFAYLTIVLAGSYKNLHYIMPVAWVLLAPALEASGPWLRASSLAILATVFAFSWPTDPGISAQTARLGREACVVGLDYEAAALAAEPVYEVLTSPSAEPRFGLSKHTFVRYGLDLGGRDCVLGLSRVAPLDAQVLFDDGVALWTRDLNRFVRWRFAPMTLPSSRLFPRLSFAGADADATRWPPSIDLTQAPGSWLRIGAGGPDLRLLVPVGAQGDGEVAVRFSRRPESVAEVTVNGRRGEVQPDPLSPTRLRIRGAMHAGWSLLELRGGGSLSPLGIEVGSQREK